MDQTKTQKYLNIKTLKHKNKSFLGLLGSVVALWLVSTPVLAQKATDLGADIEPITGSIGDAGGDPASALEKILTQIVGFLTIIAGIWFIIYFMMGAFTWITSGGDQQKLDQARQRITNAVIGMVVVVAAYGIMVILGKVLGIDFLDPVTLIGNITP